MNRLIIFSTCAVVILTSFFLLGATRKKIENPSATNGFAIVELFTSEGCSSCPPADEAVIKLVKEYPEKVYVLGFHVDYWNYIGWKDEFSKADYSERQRNYALKLGLTGVYTPQVVVNGTKEFIGSDLRLLQSEVQDQLKENGTSTIKLDSIKRVNNTISVSYKVNAPGKIILNSALVQLHASTEVKRGENKGRRLNHINIVRDLKSVEINSIKEGTVIFILPQGLTTNDVKLIVFLQEKKSGKIIAATEATG